MAWVNVRDMEQHIPLDVYDADGVLIDELIVGFDTETGVVEHVEAGPDGRALICHELGSTVNYSRKYKAPLTWRNVSRKELRHKRAQNKGDA